ncbi:MAG: shikimate dehydrogenase [Pyrinomonadaceae bacterium]
MNQGKICVSICGKTVAEVLGRIEQARDLADVIEVRFDYLLPEEIDPLLEILATRPEQLIITFRPEHQGGARSLSRDERIAFWNKVAVRLSAETLVDLECDMDFTVNIESDRIIGSAHRFDDRPTDPSQYFEHYFDELLQFSSGARKLAVAVNDASDAVDVWKLLIESGQPAIAIGMGEAGKWTRILALAYGAFLTYASLDSTDVVAPGQISAAELRDVFRVKEIDARTHVYAVLAGNTSYSLSPYMQNAAFRQADVDAVFVPMQVGNLDAFIRRMVNGATREIELHFKGFSVTNPHKQSIIRHLDHIDETARKIGAVNTVKIDHGKRIGYNTDAVGFITPLSNIFDDLRGSRATVVGAGGAARACVYALKKAGADVTILARDSAKGSAMAEEFDVRFERLTTGHQHLSTDILVNATPLGTTGEHEQKSIASANELAGLQLVYDLVYNPAETKLIKEARAAGVKTLGGLDMLIAQGARQFEIWTGGVAPVDEMRAAVEQRLKQSYAA